jgi:hypothetical protein
VDTAWIYPRSNIEYVLSTTSYPHTFDGTNIVAADVQTLLNIAQAIFDNTAAELPTQGYNLATGSLLQDLGDTLEFKLSSGLVVARWRLAKTLFSAVGGATPVGKVGFIPVFYSHGNAIGEAFDPVRCVRIG